MFGAEFGTQYGEVKTLSLCQKKERLSSHIQLFPHLTSQGTFLDYAWTQGSGASMRKRVEKNRLHHPN